MNYSVSANMDGMHYGNLSEMDYTNGDFLYDYSQMDYPGQMKVIPHWQSVIKIAVYVVIMITAIIGNVLIIVVVARNKRMRTTTNFYIVNLAVSDLLVTGFCTWVRLVDDLTEGWVLGTFFCKVNTFAQGKDTNITVVYISSKTNATVTDCCICFTRNVHFEN